MFRLTRRQWLRRVLPALIAGGLGTGGYLRFLEPHWFQVHEEKLSLGFSHLQSPLRLLHLSDLHASPEVSYDLIEKGIDLGIALQPELICITGDFITNKLTGRDRYVEILKKLSQTAPCFACLGNHDGSSWSGRHGGYRDHTVVADLLRAAGVRLLFNEKALFKRADGTGIQIAGLGDLWSEESRPGKILTKASPTSADEPTIVLSHNPDSKVNLARYQWDLMLCGHTHGGQLVVPIFGWTPFA
ncbi:MAG: phosphodiesterase YaeI, partial [Verrucomicrobiota bacterium]